MEQKDLELEAVLFAYGKYTHEDELVKLLQTTKPAIQKRLQKIQEHYKNQTTALQVVELNNQWKLTVRDNYLDLVKSIVSRTELDRPTMETLAVLATKQPMLQSDVISLRGSGAYEHIKTLLEAGYITKDKFQRSFNIKLTTKFFDYFDLPQEDVQKLFSEFQKAADDMLEEEKEKKKSLEEQDAIEDIQRKNTQLDNFSQNT